MTTEATGDQAPTSLPSVSTNSLPSHRYSILISGAMNPAIHHPFWYNHYDLLSEHEASAAAGSVSMLPNLLSQFTFDGCQVLCRQENWEISTSDGNLRSRILGITSRLFDELLPHTPVSSFSFGHRTYHLIAVEARPALAQIIQKAGLPMVPELEAANFAFQARGPDGGFSHYQVEPSARNPTEVFIAINASHPVGRGNLSEFSLQPLLERFYQIDFQQARAYAAALVEVLNRMDGVNHAIGG